MGVSPVLFSSPYHLVPKLQLGNAFVWEAQLPNLRSSRIVAVRFSVLAKQNFARQARSQAAAWERGGNGWRDSFWAGIPPGIDGERCLESRFQRLFIVRSQPGALPQAAYDGAPLALNNSAP
jgi:hypothetical protein